MAKAKDVRIGVYKETILALGAEATTERIQRSVSKNYGVDKRQISASLLTMKRMKIIEMDEAGFWKWKELPND